MISTLLVDQITALLQRLFMVLLTANKSQSSIYDEGTDNTKFVQAAYQTEKMIKGFG